MVRRDQKMTGDGVVTTRLNVVGVTVLFSHQCKDKALER